MNNFLKRFLGFIVCFVMVSGLSTGANATSAATQGSVATQTGRVIADGTYSFVSSLNRNVALDLDTVTKNVEIQLNYITRETQMWDVKWSDSAQAYEIRSADPDFNDRFLSRGSDLTDTNVYGQRVYSPSALLDDSLWKATQNPDGSFRFQTKHAPPNSPDLMLDLYAGQTHDGTNVLVRERNGEPSQNWRLTKTPCTSYPDPSCAGRVIADGKYHFRSSSNENMLLDLNLPTNNVEIRSANITQATQVWDVKWFDPEQAYKIVSAYHFGDGYTRALSTTFDLTDTNVYAHKATTALLNNSFWKATEHPDGSFSFQTKRPPQGGSNLMLDTYVGQTHDGNNVLVSERNGAMSQNWRLIKVPCIGYPDPSCTGRVIADGKYSFRPSRNLNRLLVLNTYNTNVGIGTDDITRETQVWDVKWSDSAQAYEIRSADPDFNDRFLSRRFDLTDTNVYGQRVYSPSVLLDNSLWKATQNPDGSFSFQTKHAPPNSPDLMLDLYAGHTSPGTNVWVWERNGEPSQNWILTPEI